MAVTLWTGTPTVAEDNGTNGTYGLTLGVKFNCNVAGEITHLRYYEHPNTRGTVTLRLIASNSTVIDTVTHTAVAGQSGWRQVALTTPYEVSVNQKLMVTSYITATSMGFDYNYGTLSSLGSAYSTSGNEYTSIIDGATTIAGSTGNGVYEYSNVATTIPTNTFGSSNYALDFVFEPGVGLDVPANLTAVAVSRSQINLAWDAVTGASGYDIERDSSVIVSSHPTNSYSDNGLNTGSQHTYRVRSVGD